MKGVGMSTWNRKRREEARGLQLKFGKPKRQVLCIKCEKVHDHPVCSGVHELFLYNAVLSTLVARKDAARKKKLAREEQAWRRKRKAQERSAKRYAAKAVAH